MNILADIEKSLKKKGLHSHIPYTAEVIDNKDPAKLQRVRARIPKFQDHMADTEIPWSVPSVSHPMGLVGGELGRTGSCSIPTVGAMVAIYFPNAGDPSISKYSTERIVDQTNVPPEFEVNYPNRLGYVLPNGYTFIIDTRTNEMFLDVPGDANINILGDANITSVGNINLKATDDVGKIPAYLRNAPERVLGQLEANPQKKIEFEGLYGGSAGNIHLEADGHITMQAGKKIQAKSKGDMKLDVGGKMETKVSSTYDMKSGGKAKLKAPRIDLN